MSIGTLRSRFHPLFHLRRVRVARAALAVADKPAWAHLEGVDWPVRVRRVRHASYRFRSSAPEREIAALAQALVDVLPIERFADVGANFGYYSWLVKSRARDLAVELVEPEPENLALIEATLARNALSRVTVHGVAVSDSGGSAVFHRDPVSGATGSLEPATESFAGRHWGAAEATIVATTTLDDLLVEGADLLKVDVEGHEERVLQGARRLLERHPPVVLFECFHGEEAAAATLRALGYQLYDAETLELPTASTTNYLALPTRISDRISEIRDRCRSYLGA